MSKAAFDRQRAAIAIDGSPVEKHVLLVLATRANESGVCNPGIPRIALDTGLSERSVHRALVALEAGKHITREIKMGVGTVYRVHPCPTVTPDIESPLTDSQSTPDTVASKQPRTPSSSTKATLSPKKRARKRPPSFALPDDIPLVEWGDFEEMRKLIRKPMTDKARHQAVARLRKLAEAGYPPGDVLNHSTLNNYQGLFPPKDDRNGRTNRMAGSGQPGNRSRDGFINAIREARANREAVPWATDDDGGVPRLAGVG